MGDQLFPLKRKKRCSLPHVDMKQTEMSFDNLIVFLFLVSESYFQQTMAIISSLMRQINVFVCVSEASCVSVSMYSAL